MTATTLNVASVKFDFLQCRYHYTQWKMSAKNRGQLSDADRKLICELAQSHTALSQQQLTNLVSHEQL